ncbi:hypothetical protein [Enterobacter roggenkampii]|jgi:hypothetical protein|uniref:hypothetical protein n=1 Tax=Enterobacter roggenkampii TaxID=1812935 RepID=UPI00111F2974|nr:hypothetical protein [Enterobacter roggenkampii]ELT5307620.1 hypothetical protein [Enterobacter roggenkampii]EMF1897489.1 hypothetical protein [Enterobacter roggenkampii]EMF1898874.1 hypothetical protein [Enterobacter roggenkampii]TOY97505.1 hypothetical protein DI388_12605 [Escherichia coli]
MTKNYSFEDKRKKLLVTAVIFSVLGGWLWYMSWASGISHNTILKKSVPEWMTYISLGVLIGTIFVMRVFYLRTFNKTLEYIASAFFSGFCLGFVLSLNGYDIYVYLFPDKIIGYESEYEVVFPGPSRGKHGHCEAGLWLKDQNTNRWIQLCTNKEYLHSHRKQGMTGVWVTARVNNIGSYIVSYEFIYL